MAEIVVVVPVLARPQNAQALADSLAASTDRVRLLFVCSPDDTEQIAACQVTGADVLVASWKPGPADFARKINLGYHESSEPFVFQGADDLEFTPGWADAALTAIEAGPYSVCGTQDTANPSVKAGQHSTHTLFRRSYCDDPGASMDGPGTVFSTAYDHQRTDDECVAVAKARGVWTFAHKAVVIHRHPIWGTAPNDSTYIKALARGKEDADIFKSRRHLWEAERVAS